MRLLTYDKLFEDVKAYKLPDELLKYRWLAVSRGALALGQMLASMHDKHLGVIDPRAKQCILPPKDFNLGLNFLLIDDVAKTGETIKECKKILSVFAPKADMDVKTLFYIYDPNNIAEAPDYHILKTDEWLILPWEPGDEGRS